MYIVRRVYQLSNQVQSWSSFNSFGHYLQKRKKKSIGFFVLRFYLVCCGWVSDGKNCWSFIFGLRIFWEYLIFGFKVVRHFLCSSVVFSILCSSIWRFNFIKKFIWFGWLKFNLFGRRETPRFLVIRSILYLFKIQFYTFAFQNKPFLAFVKHNTNFSQK